MSDADWPADVDRLIARAAGSLDHVEVLRALHASRETSTDAEGLGRRLHLDRETVGRILADLRLAGLVSEINGAYKYAASSRDRPTVDALLEIYEARPIALVRAIQSRPRPLHSFASAFRLRRKD
jgi:hypothetical protein